MTKECIVLAGGYGSRLGKITRQTPKPLIKIYEKPFIFYLIDNLYRQGIRKFFILTFYKHQKFTKVLPRKYKNATIQVIKEKEKLGTAGSINNIKKKLDQSFFVVNGDSYFDINLRDLENITNNSKSSIGVAIISSHEHKDYKSYKINNQNEVIDYKKTNSKLKLVCGGIYFFKKKIFNKFKKYEILDIDKDLIEKNLKKKIIAKKYKSDFIDIGSIESLRKSKNFIKKKYLRPCFFLDRDGVINEDKNYVHKKKNFIWRKNIFKAIKLLNDNGYQVFIITNQAGIGKGLYSEKQFHILNDWMLNEFIKKGSFIDQVYYCPYHPQAKIKKFRKKTNLRKPGNGMILKAFKEWGISRTNSFLIGDSLSDIYAGKKSKISSHLVKRDIFKQIYELIF
jgi:D,D-heptose 1,7-bisphosphate phosphatase